MSGVAGGAAGDWLTARMTSPIMTVFFARVIEDGPPSLGLPGDSPLAGCTTPAPACCGQVGLRGKGMSHLFVYLEMFGGNMLRMLLLRFQISYQGRGNLD